MWGPEATAPLTSTNKWESTLGDWAGTYAAGTSVDWDTVDYLPGSSTVWGKPQEALRLWSVMVTSYWSSLSEHVASAPAVPTWISDFNDEECPLPD